MEHINRSLDMLAQQLKAYFKILNEFEKGGMQESTDANLQELFLMATRVKKMAHYVDNEVSDILNKTMANLGQK